MVGGRMMGGVGGRRDNIVVYKLTLSYSNLFPPLSVDSLRDTVWHHHNCVLIYPNILGVRFPPTHTHVHAHTRNVHPK